ncbi:MAG: CSLREA domain-containing protein [Caldilineaceae bacterium]
MAQRILSIRIIVTGLMGVLIFVSFRLVFAAPVVITVDTTADENGENPAKCSLREAITTINNGSAFGGCTFGDTINFSLGAGTPSIAITAALPIAVKPLVIDGNSGGATRVELNGAGAGANANGLTLVGGSSIIKSLVINRFGKQGITLSIKGGNKITDCYIGLDSTGAIEQPNGDSGIFINNTANNTIGGATPAERNVIASNSGSGIVISGASATGNIVQGNYIGTGVTGTEDLGNTLAGIFLDNVADNLIGGSVAGAGNVIGNNQQSGVNIAGSSANHNKVIGNLIGTDATGASALPNAPHGIYIVDAHNNVIGGTTATERNVIAGNDQSGIFLDTGTAGTLIQGNYIGVRPSGLVALGNGANGITINGATDNIIGGTTGTRNIIGGNLSHGILMLGAGATGNLVQSNYVGLKADGAGSLSNLKKGVFISGAPNNTIGGDVAGAGNVISGNHEDGVYILGSTATGNKVQGNTIGADPSGMTKLANTATGITVDNAPDTLVGGTTAGARNVVSGNDDVGICLINGAVNSLVQGNYAGVAADGVTSLGNKRSGVLLRNSNVTIGGTGPGEGNIIAYNQDKGVTITTGAGNAILSNSIFSNTNLGIDLGLTGVTPNDTGDSDTGANNLQNFPILLNAVSAGGSTAITGTLSSKPNATFTIQFFANQFCDASGNGEGQTLLGTTSVTTNSAGNALISFTIASAVPLGYAITSTATDSDKSTSEFSACSLVTGAPGSSTPTPTVTNTPGPGTPTATPTPQNPVYLPYVRR